MVDFTRYVPPGVYVEDENTSIVTALGVEPTVACLVGPAIGYFTHTESLTFTTDSVVLTQKGADTSTIQASRTTYDANGIPTTTTFVKGTDSLTGDYYVSSVVLDPITGVAGQTVTLTRRAQGTTVGIQPGDVVTFTYRYADAAYHDVKTFEDYDSFVQAYGRAIDLNTGAVVSPLSLACKVAFENGANRVFAVATSAADGDLNARTAKALAKTANLHEVNVIVPLMPVEPATTGTEAEKAAADDGAQAQALSTVRAHVDAASLAGFRRVAIVGLDQRYRTSADRMANLARGVQNSRVMLAFPNALNYYNGGNNTTVVVDGFYLAAAYAGRLSALRIQDALTRKIVRGFAGIAPAVPQTTRTRQAKDTMSSAGVAVTEIDRSNRLVIRHGTTTDRTSLTSRELSVVRARDALFNLMQDGVDEAGLIGTPIDNQTPIRVKGVISGLLEAAVNSGVVVGYSDLKVRQQTLPTGDPSVIEVRFAYQPALPLNYIVVAFSLNVQTGETTPLAESV